MKINIKDIIYKIADNRMEFDENTDLIESGILDSLGMIELFSILDDMNINLQITQIDRNKLRTISGIESLVNDYLNKKK